MNTAVVRAGIVRERLHRMQHERPLAIEEHACLLAVNERLG
jgi:hypothetical protein